MQWVEPFFSQGGRWWGPAEAIIEPEHHERAGIVERYCGAESMKILELGAGYGATAAVLAERGHRVTAVELSSVRADYARRFAESRPTLTIAEGDFFTLDAGRGYDALIYWNGFGVGTDADQRRLLRRIADEWLRPGGMALVTAFSPWYWAQEAGKVEHKPARPQVGYAYDLTQSRDFDPVGCRFVERWCPTGVPEQTITQTFRCYSPSDLILLLEGTGLSMVGCEANGQTIDLAQPYMIDSPVWREHEYLAILIHET